MTDPSKTTKTVAKKRSYRIADLLANSIQPFDDLAPDELAALGKDLDLSSGHVMAIISTTGRLMDGNQRLRALAQTGAETLPGTNVVIDQLADESAEFDRAVMLNVRRRQLTGKQKADWARKIMAERGISQNAVAAMFGISSSAMSQLMGNYPATAATPVPATTTAKDGSIRKTGPKASSKTRAPKQPKGNVPVPALDSKTGRPKGDGLDALVAGIDAGIDGLVVALAEDPAMTTVSPYYKEALAHAKKLGFYVDLLTKDTAVSVGHFDELADEVAGVLELLDKARQAEG
jgi:hypothetical protein